MRYLIGFALLGVIVLFLWNHFADSEPSLERIPEPKSTAVTHSGAIAHPTPTVSGSWMWNENRRTKLDRKASDRRLGDEQRQLIPPAPTTPKPAP